MFKSKIVHPLNTTVSATLLGLTLLSMVGTAQATILELDFSNSGAFSGTAPSSPSDPSAVYAKAIFDDLGGSGSVTLTMSVLSGLLPAGTYVNDWYFNSSITPLASITHVSGDTATAGNSPNAFKADGTGGGFDINFSFPTPNPGQIGQGGNSVYALTGTGLTANSFNSLSVPDPNGGGYLGAVHVQGYGNSVWIAASKPVSPVPEPKTYAMLLAGLALVSFSARRRKNFAA
jgi:hypothetical protein